jgi:hypothetical protein
MFGYTKWALKGQMSTVGTERVMRCQTASEMATGRWKGASNVTTVRARSITTIPKRDAAGDAVGASVQSRSTPCL